MPTKRTPPPARKERSVSVSSIVTCSRSPAMAPPIVDAALAATANPVAIGISPDLLAYMQKQDQERKEERQWQEQLRKDERQDRMEERQHAEKVRKEDLDNLARERDAQFKVHEVQIQLLKDQLAKSTMNNSGNSKSSVKMPLFDLEKDQENFPIWKADTWCRVRTHTRVCPVRG